MGINIKNLRNLFYIFLTTHLIIWTAIPSLTNNNLPLDTIEALAWGSNLDWKAELVKTNNKALYNSSLDDNSASADIVDQASSYTEKNVEMRAINRQIKLISKIDAALKRIEDGTYGYCKETGEPIGLKRLMARPVAPLSITAQEKHEKEEKVFADD